MHIAVELIVFVLFFFLRTTLAKTRLQFKPSRFTALILLDWVDYCYEASIPTSGYHRSRLERSASRTSDQIKPARRLALEANI